MTKKEALVLTLVVLATIVPLVVMLLVSGSAEQTQTVAPVVTEELDMTKLVFDHYIPRAVFLVVVLLPMLMFILRKFPGEETTRNADDGKGKS